MKGLPEIHHLPFINQVGEFITAADKITKAG